MERRPEEMTDLEIVDEEYMAVSGSLDIAEALAKQTSDILHKTALHAIVRTYYRLMETGQVRLERAHEAEQAKLG